MLGIAGFAVPLAAQSNGGAAPESYLLRGVSARAIAMGDAYTAVANDPAAMYYNPAGLAFQSQRPQVGGMFSALDFERRHNYLAYGQSFADWIGAGISVNNYDAGTITGRDAAGNPLGTYENRQLAAAGGVAFRTRNISAGASGKYLLNTLDGADIKADGWAVDVGMKMQLLDVISVGVAANNLFGELQWNNDSKTVEEIRYSIRGGVAVELQLESLTDYERTNVLGEIKTERRRSDGYILLALDAEFHEKDKHTALLLGAEIAPIRELALRGGFPIVNDDRGVSRVFAFNRFGAGLSLRVIADEELPFRMHLDYALSKSYLNTDKISHHLSILLQF